MNDRAGWIKLHRSLLSWEWYDDPVTFKVFLHLLLTANTAASRYRGIFVPAGSLITGRDALSQTLGFSPQQIRTALKKLKSTNEITSTNHVKFSLISITKYETYQSNQPAKQPAINQQSTSNQPHQKNKELRKDIYGGNGEPDGFSEFWEAWKPHGMDKGNRQRALANYKKALKSENPPNLKERASQYLANCEALDRKSQHASTWLYQHGWEDEMALKTINGGNHGNNISKYRQAASGSIGDAILTGARKGAEQTIRDRQGSGGHGI